MGGWASIPGGLAVIATMIASPAYAFDSGAMSDTSSTGYLSVEESAAFSRQIERELAAKSARIAMVFRSGRERDRLPENVRYTHGALWVYQDIQREDGTLMKGYAVYNLFHGDGDTLPRTQSYIKQDFPLDFVIGSAVDDVAAIIPHPVVQNKMLKVVASARYTALHVPHYSIISNAGDPAYQNCNEFMLDVIASAIWNTDDYGQIKANLSRSFKPTRIRTGILERIFAPIADERIRLGDQDGDIETVT